MPAWPSMSGDAALGLLAGLLDEPAPQPGAGKARATKHDHERPGDELGRG